MTDDPRYILLGRVPLRGILFRAELPEGYPREEGTEAFVAAIGAEAERQALEAKLAAAPLLSPQTAHGT
jgi:hypothetical protein